MNPTLPISVACVLLLLASRTNAQGSLADTSQAINSVYSVQKEVAPTTTQDGMCVGGGCRTNSTKLVTPTSTTTASSTPKASAAPSHIKRETNSSVAASSVTPTTPGDHGNTTGTSISSTTAASAAGPSPLWSAAYMDVLVASLGALLWWSSL